MNIRFLLVLATVLGIASCGQPQDTAMDGVPGCTTGNRIEIKYPADTAMPSANPDCLHVERPGGAQTVMVRFEVSPGNGKDTTIEFTKDNAVGSQGAGRDCRTPLPPKGGKPQCVVNVRSDGTPRAVNIADDLGACDLECNRGEIDCMKEHCSYKYNVQDTAGEHDLLDPQIIVDPR